MKLALKHKIIYFLTALLFLVCGLSTMNLSFDEKITAMLPDSDPMSKDFKFIVDTMPATEVVYIDIQSLQGDKALLEKAADDFYGEIRDLPFFTEIVYRFSYEGFANLLTLMRKNRSFLLDSTDLGTIESRLSPKEISTRVKDIKRRLLDPAGMFMAESLILDPLEIDALILSKLDTFKDEAYGMKIQGSRIFSKNSDHLLMMATPSFPAVDTRQSFSMMTDLHEARDRITNKYGRDIRIGFSGNHVATLDNSRTIQQDVKRTVTALTCGILVIGILFFRRKMHAALIFLPTLVSMTVASAVISFFYDNVSAIALGCGAVLIGITVDFGIHVLYGVDAGQSRSPRMVIRNLRRPIFAGACTTMAAFSCLAFSSLAGQRQMGVFAVIGIGTAGLFAVFVLQYFIPKGEGNSKAPLVDLVGACDWLMAVRKKHLRLISMAGVILVIMGGAGIQSFEFDGDVTRLNHLQPETRMDMDVFLETWGGLSPSLVLVKAASLDNALEKNDVLYALLKDMQDQGLVSRIATLSDIFPSRQKRDDNYRQFKKVFNSKKLETFKKLFENAALESGFKPDTFQVFLDSLEHKIPVFTLDAFGNTVLKQLMDSKVISHKNEVFVLTSMQVTDKTQIPGVIARIKTKIPDALFLDKKYFVSTITDLVAREFKQLFVFAAVVMILVVTLFFRNLKIAAIIISPVFCAAFITAGILGLLRIPVNLISMIFIIFVFGVGVDFSIFLANHELNKSGDEANVTAGAVIVCAMTTVGAFVCLVFARHEALFSIGVAGLTGMVSCLVLSLILIPTLAEIYRPERKRGDSFE